MNMDYKKFFWATKEKVLLTLALFVLANIFFLPIDDTGLWGREPTELRFYPIWDYLSEPRYPESIYKLNVQFEIVYLGFSYLVACIVFHMKNKGGK